MSSRIHHTELRRRDMIGIILGWFSLGILLIGLLCLAGTGLQPVWVKAVLGTGLATGVAYLAMRWQAATTAVGYATGRHANGTVFILAVLAILGLGNYIASRHYWQRDLTKQQLNSLAPQSKEVIKSLKSPLTLTGYFSERGRQGSEAERVRTMLKRYQEVAKKKVTIQFVNPIADPTRAMQDGVQMVPTVVVEYEGRKEMVTNAVMGEQEITSAIVKVSRATAKKIYFLIGHGEVDPDSYEQRPGSLSLIKQALGDLKYEVAKLELLKTRAVPSDATEVIVAGPETAIPPDEQKMLSDYLGGGGKILLLLKAGKPVPTDLTTAWGVQVGDGTINDPNPRNPRGVGIVSSFETHQVTKDMQALVLPLARPVDKMPAPPAGVTVTSLGKAADTSGDKSAAVVVTKDLSSAPSSGSSATQMKKMARMIVVGSTAFTGDDYVRYYSNARFALNSINWLAEEETLLSIPAKEPDYDQISLMPNQARWIFLLTVLIVPLGVVATGVTVWWRRR